MLQAMVWVQVSVMRARQGLTERWGARRSDERGQTAAEYLGIVVLVAAVIAAIFQLGIAGKIAGGIGGAIESILTKKPT